MHGNRPRAGGRFFTGGSFFSFLARAVGAGWTAAACLWLGGILQAGAATLTVTNTADSGAGSLRQAILSANGTANVPDVIQFNIPGTGPHVISPASPLPAITDPLTVNGYSQPGADTNSLASGNNAVLKVEVRETLVVDTTNTVIRGLAVRQIQLGLAPGSKGSNTIEGCFIGLDASGTNALGSTGSGIFVQTPNNRIGGITSGARNVISGHGTTGLEIFETFATGNFVQGNYIGTDRTGTKAIANTDRALVVNMNASGNTIGGLASGAGNLISGNLNRGITLDGANNFVQGNFIGTDVTGLKPLGNARSGVEISGPGNVVGGTNAGAANVIAFNGIDGGGVFTTNGVDVANGATGYSILGNSIFDNAGLGIDINANGLPTPGYPVLTAASNTIAGTLIRGTHTPSSTFRLEVFSNPAPDSSGYGEGRTLLASTNVTTDGTGNFTLNWPVPIAPGLFVTATANGVTEFSQARIVATAGGPNSWTNALGGKWETGSNWSLRVAPYSGHSLILITNAGSKTVTNDAATAAQFPTTLTISNLFIGAPTGATNTLLLAHGGTGTPLILRSNLNVTSGGALKIENSALRLEGSFNTGLRVDGSASLAGGSITVTNSGTRLIVGDSGRGALSVADGFVFAEYSIVGANNGSDGVWRIAGGTNIVDGGAFDIADNLTATGTVVVTGGRLQFPNGYVGLFGNGSLFVSNGVVQCPGTVLVGSQDGSQGRFVAAGGTSIFGGMQIRESPLAFGSALVTGSAQVQVNGLLDNRGSVTVDGGRFGVLGQVDSTAAGNSISVLGGELAATNDSAFLTSVTVSNGTFLARDLFLGNQKTGVFNLAAGLVALVGSFNGFNVGVNGGTGTVSQTGGVILATNTSLNIGGLFSPAIGLLSISNAVTHALDVFIGGQGGGTGTVAMAGGVLASTNLVIGGSGWRSQLTASNAASVLTRRSGAIGLETGANSNLASLTGPGTQWQLGSNLYVGSNGAISRLLVSEGAVLADTAGTIGNGITSSNNLAVVAGLNSIWSNATELVVGLGGRSNQIVVSNGGFVRSITADIGRNVSSSNNQVLISGPGAFLHARDLLTLGNQGSGCRLVVSNGAWVRNDNAFIGLYASNNEAVVTGPGSIWTNTSGLYVGRYRGGNRLLVTNGGFIFSRGIYIGLDPLSASNRVVIDGGTLHVTNSTGLGEMDVRRGTNVFNAGLIDVTQLWMLDPLGAFEFNGGTLRTSVTTNANGRVFRVGDGIRPAAFQLQGGTHVFANNLVISSNASLTGNGLVIGGVTNAGLIAPGASAGQISISGPLVLSNSSELAFELGGYAPATASDSLFVTGSVTLAGKLSVSLIDDFQSRMTNGSGFTLLTAPNNLAGAFSNVASGGQLTTPDGYARFTVNYAGTNTVRLAGLVMVDTDNDTIPNWWEDRFGLNKNSAADAALDADSDGASNLDEFRAGTNPTNAASVFKITAVQRQGDNLRITWNAVGGKSYRVQTNNTAPAGGISSGFGDLSAPIAVLGNGDTSTNFLHVGALTNMPVRFYRIRLDP